MQDKGDHGAHEGVRKAIGQSAWNRGTGQAVLRSFCLKIMVKAQTLRRTGAERYTITS